jgi:hypothetical protein
LKAGLKGMKEGERLMSPGKWDRLYRLCLVPSTAQGRSSTRTFAAGVAVLLGIASVAVVAFWALEPGADDLRARAGRLRTASLIERSTLGGTTVEELRLTSTSGLSARCAVRRPGGPGTESATSSLRRARGARSALPGPRYPGFLIAAGYETGRRAVTFPEARGVILLACDYPFDLPPTLEGLSFWRALPEMRRAVLDTPATLLLGLDYLASRPDVDPRSIAVVGASVGVPPATVAAALDRRPRAVALLYGGGDLPLLFSHNLDLGSAASNRLARFAVRLLTRPVEPTRYAGSLSPRPVLAVNSPADPFIPLASATALHRALREPKEIRWLPLDHFAAFHERDLLAQLTELATEWFHRQGIG